MTQTEAKGHREPTSKEHLEQAITKFGSLIREYPRFFRDDVETIIIEPFDESNPASGFKITLIEDLSIDAKKFIEDRKAGVSADEKVIFDEVLVFPLNETPIRRVVLVANRAATMHMQDIDVAVMPYVHKPGENHRGHMWVMSSDYNAAMYLEGLKRRIELDADEVDFK